MRRDLTADTTTKAPLSEEEFERLRCLVKEVKTRNDYGLGPLRVRGLACVQLQADLAILARLALALKNSFQDDRVVCAALSR